MTQNKHNNQNGWFWAALVALLFAAPNPMIIRIFVAESIDPFFLGICARFRGNGY